MENEGRIIGEGFGQRERLTVRLRGLIRSYPRSIGIVKEFLQNADDAGATRLWVIWDGREHARDNLPDPRMARLQGPALLFANDQVFSEADFQAIRSIGESSKSELGPKTGRFGLGFNTAYNVSDYPSFVSGRWAIAFDPHRVTVADADEPTGKRWELAELWERADDWLRTFGAGGLRDGELAHAGTIFRLPIRTPAQAEESEICDEPFDRGDFEQMLEDLEAAGDELLLFARNVLDLRVTAIDPDGAVHELLELTTVNSNEVQAKRAVGNAAVDGDTADNITTWRSDPETLARVAYRQMIAIQTPTKREVRAWQVASGLFVDGYDRILRLNEQMLSLHEKALPWVGAAIRLDLRDDGRLAVAPRQRGKLFCTFPLPEQPVRLACHINGCFDLDASRRQISTDPALYAEADRARVAWNYALLEHAVPQAVALAISALAPDIAETSLTPYYDLWPDLSKRPDDPWRGFSEGLLRRLASLPLIRTRAGDEIAWEPLRESRLPPPLWGELLQEALRDDGLRLPDPDLPGRMVKSAERADVVTIRYRPQQLRDWLRGDEPFAEAPLEEASRLCLRERSHVVDLLQFCLSDRKDDLAGLPLALCADGILRAFGGQPVFLADGPTRRLFEGHPEWFIDVGIQSGTRLRPCPEAQLDAMELPQVVTMIAGLLDPGDAATLAFDPEAETPPNAPWLAEVLRFFGERGDKLTADALDGVALFPDGRGQLHRAAAARPLLLPADDADPALLDALDAIGVVYVSTAPPLGDALRNFNRRRPGLMTPLSGPSLALALRHRGDAIAELAADAPARETILDYLATPTFLDAYEAEALDALRGLPLLRTRDGQVRAADAPGLYLPAGFQAPPLKGASFDLVDTGSRDRWRSLMTALGLATMDRERFIAEVLLPAYAEQAAEEQRTALLWLRDEVDLAALAADAPELVDDLRAAPLLRGHDGELRPAAALYDPGDDASLLDQHSLVPDFDFYADARDRWRRFFAWLGLRETPQAAALVRHVDALREQASGDLEVAEERLRDLLRYLHELWPLLHERDPEDATAFAEALRGRAWLPPIRRAPAAVAFAAPAPRLYRGDELTRASQLDLVASQRPALDADDQLLDPGFLAAIGVAAEPPPAAVAAHLAVLRDRWAAADHGGLTPAELDRITAAIYAYFGRLDEPPPAAAIDDLVKGPCIWDPERQRFWLTDHAFGAPIADLFGDRRGFVPGDGDVRRGLDRLGRRTHVEPVDIASMLTSVAEERGSRPLDEQGLTFVNRLLRRLVDLRGDDSEAPLPPALVPTTSRRLAPASRVLVADAPWFVARLRGAPVALLHPRVSEEVVAALGLRRLSQAAHEEVAEAPALSGSPDKQAFCRELAATIHHPAFKAGLRRLLAAAGRSDPAVELDLLSELRIEATDRLLTHLRIAGVDQPLGAEEVAIFADDRAKVIYIGGDHWDTVVVQISEAINRLLGGGLDNLSHLEAILRTRPPEILDLLDHRRVPRLHGADEVALRADADADADADDEAVDFAAAAESLFDEAPEPPPAQPKGRAIGLERVAFVAADEPAAGDRNPVSIAAIAAAIAAERDADRKAVEMPAGTPGYDVQSGRISDPQARFIRVYGLDGPWEKLPVVLSSRDASAARTFGRQYWLYIVEHARDSGRARVHKLQDPLSRIARYALDHRWREQAERDGGGAQTPQVGWIHHPPAGEAATIVGVEKVGMFTWVRVRLASGKEERRFFKPAIDRVEPS